MTKIDYLRFFPNEQIDYFRDRMVSVNLDYIVSKIKNNNEEKIKTSEAIFNATSIANTQLCAENFRSRALINDQYKLDKLKLWL